MSVRMTFLWPSHYVPVMNTTRSTSCAGYCGIQGVVW